MFKHTYKALGVLILIYSFVAGMLIPLSPGIVQVSPSRAVAGEAVELHIVGYNSQYIDGNVRAWLRVDAENLIAAETVVVENDRNLKVHFKLPDYLPTSEKITAASLIVDNTNDGVAVLPSAVFINQAAPDSTKANAAAFTALPEDLNARPGITFPFRNILQESIRNTYFHVSLWFALIFLLGAAVYHAIQYNRTQNIESDIKSAAFTQVGLLFGILGLVTGAVWAEYTWGKFWSWDVKQNSTAIALLIYAAYFVLRNSLEDEDRRARISAVYSTFAYVALIILLYVIPRMTDSLHPGNGGNPGLGGEDLDSTMRMVFYPAIIGWILVGTWISNLSIRASKIRQHLLDA